MCVCLCAASSGFVDYGGSSTPGAAGAASGSAGLTHLAHRLTPHAFSRFTFDRSAGALMVVDIQGCDDVYTDPQIHTNRGEEYGEGNLGVGGVRASSGARVACRTLRGSPRFLDDESIRR